MFSQMIFLYKFEVIQKFCVLFYQKPILNIFPTFERFHGGKYFFLLFFIKIPATFFLFMSEAIQNF